MTDSTNIELRDFLGARWYVRRLGRDGSITVTSQQRRARCFAPGRAAECAGRIRADFAALYTRADVVASEVAR